MELSIIIVEYGADKYVKQCLKSIPKKHNWEIVEVDNNKDNVGFGRGCNEGVRRAKGEYLLFLNPDTKIVGKALEIMLQSLKRDSNIGMVGPRLLDQQGQPYLSITRQPTKETAWWVYSFLNKWFPNNWRSIEYWYKDVGLDAVLMVESISGAAMMMRKTDFMKINMFDENYFMYWEDYDLCKKVMEMGKKILYNPRAEIFHLKEKSTNRKSMKVKWWFTKSRFYFFKKHLGVGDAVCLSGWLVLGETWRWWVLFAMALGLIIL